MTTHELAAKLVALPDQDIAFHVNGHTYSSRYDRRSHGPVMLGLRRSRPQDPLELVLGNMLDYVRDVEVVDNGREPVSP